VWNTVLIQGSDAWERAIAEWLHPGFDYDNRVTRGWAFTRLDHALAAVGVYSLIIVWGLLRRATDPARLAGTEAAAAVPARKESKFALPRDPIRWLQVVYNIVQVRLHDEEGVGATTGGWWAR